MEKTTSPYFFRSVQFRYLFCWWLNSSFHSVQIEPKNKKKIMVTSLYSLRMAQKVVQIRNNQRQTISILNISRLYHVGLSAFDECVCKLGPLHNIMYTCLNSQKINDTTSSLRDEFELFLLNTRNYKKCRTQVVA